MTVTIALFTILLLHGCVINSSDELHKNIEHQTRSPNLIARCLNGLDDETGNKTECDIANYVNGISTSDKDTVNVILPGKSVSTISTREFLSYQTIFYDYVAISRPIRGSVEPTEGCTSVEVARICNHGLGVSLIKCMNENKV